MKEVHSNELTISSLSFSYQNWDFFFIIIFSNNKDNLTKFLQKHFTSTQWNNGRYSVCSSTVLRQYRTWSSMFWNAITVYTDHTEKENINLIYYKTPCICEIENLIPYKLLAFYAYFCNCFIVKSVLAKIPELFNEIRVTSTMLWYYLFI